MRLPDWIEMLPPFRGRLSADRKSVTFNVVPKPHAYRGMEFSASPCLDCGLHPDSVLHKWTCPDCGQVRNDMSSACDGCGRPVWAPRP
jgi:hypothetical protein